MPTKFRGPLMEDYVRALKAAKKFGAKSVRIDIGDGAITLNLAEVDETPEPNETSPAPPQSPARAPRPAHPPGEQVNDVIRDLLQSGPASLQQMRAALMRSGHSPTSVGNALTALKDAIERTGVGVYALKPHDWKQW